MNTEVSYGSYLVAQATIATTPWWPTTASYGGVYSSTPQTSATYTRTNVYTLTKAGAFTNFATGDYAWISGGTGAVVGWTKITKTDANNATLDRDLGVAASGQTDIAFTMHAAASPFVPGGRFYGQAMVLRRAYPYSSLTAGSLIVVDAGGAELTRVYASNTNPNGKYPELPATAVGFKGDGTLAGGISVTLASKGM